MLPFPIKRIEIERPANLDRQAEGGRNFDQYASAIISAAKARGVSATIVAIPGKAFFAPRIAAPETALFSFHSVGFSPNVFRIKESYIHPCYSFDRLGFGGFAEVAVSQRLQKIATTPSAEADRFAEDFRKTFAASRVSKYPQGGSAPTDFGRFIFAPLQVDSDMMAMHSHFGTTQWLAALDGVATSSGLAVVAKRHPKCRSGVIGRFITKNRNPKLVFSSASVFELIGKADAVLTVNSGVGFEALALGRKVITGGRSDYAFLTRECSSLGQILDAIGAPMPASVREVNAFLRYHLAENTFRIGNAEDAARIVAKALEPSAWDLSDDVAWRGAEFGLSYFSFHQKMMDFAATGNSKILGRFKTWGLAALARRYANLK